MKYGLYRGRALREELADSVLAGDVDHGLPLQLDQAHERRDV
jgi:hypothetical protein